MRKIVAAALLLVCALPLLGQRQRPRPNYSYLNSLVASWKLEESSGTRVNSQGGTALNLTANNAPSNGAGRAGYGNAVELNGSSQYLSLADNSTLSLGGTTMHVTLWFRQASTPATSWVGIFTKETAEAVGREYRFAIRDGGTVEWTCFGSAGSGLGWVQRTGLSTGNWYFASFYYNSSSGQIGLSINDGTVSTATLSGTPHDGSDEFRLGRLETVSTYFDGKIDAVMVWRGRVLGAAEITALYNSGNGFEASNEITPDDIAPRFALLDLFGADGARPHRRESRATGRGDYYAPGRLFRGSRALLAGTR